MRYSTNLLNMDLCGIDILNENILLAENKQDYFQEKENVSKKRSFGSSHWRWCSVRKGVLKISQISRENTCVEVTF